MVTPPFVHLAVRSAYSFREGVMTPQTIAATVAERGMQAVGVADRDGLFGSVRHAAACAEAGVTPIFGVSLALSDDDARPARPGSGPTGGRPGARRNAAPRPRSGLAWLDDDAPRLTLLARTNLGYAALTRLVSAAHGSGQGAGPRAGWHDLARACAAAPDGLFLLLTDDSPVGRLLDRGEQTAAARALGSYSDLVGRDAVLLGLTHHRAAGDDRRATARCALADRAGVRLVAHHDVRYRDPADAVVADLLDAIRGQVPLSARHSSRRGNTEGYLADAATMAVRYGERPDALWHTCWVAERCTVDLGLGRLRVPDLREDAAAPEGAMVQLRDRCRSGLAERFAADAPGLADRLDAELAVIGELGLGPYFLTVADIVDRIRAKGVLVACRGSAAGSLTTYCLRISDVDPVRHDLCFERFCNRYRKELPDIDLDVESARRPEIYDDLLTTYGSERVACLAMVDTFRARMAVREVGKALGLPAGEVDYVARSLPFLRARDVRNAVTALPEVARRGLDRPHLVRLLTLVERLDGLPRHAALHPCGILLGRGPGGAAGQLDALRDLVAVQPSGEGYAMAQIDKDDVEALGLCKLDVLSVRMLSALRHAVDEAQRVRGIDLDLTAVDDTDAATYDLIRSTRTVGMFQIESPGQRELIGRLQPEEMGDLIIDISLFRPGPVKGDMIGPFLLRRLGQTTPLPTHPLLTPALAETYGVIVYHEQVMRCVAALTGCDLATADDVRRQLADPEAAERLGRWVRAQAAARGVPADTVEAVWHAIAQFASFGFCKAHAAAFSVVTLRSAYLKTHAGPELVAGLLTHDPGMYPRRLILSDARQFGILPRPVDLNRSDGVARVEVLTAGEAWRGLGVPVDDDGFVRDEASLPAGWRVDAAGRPVPPAGHDLGADPARPGRRFGVRLGLAEVAGMQESMCERIMLERPFVDLADVRERAGLSEPVAEALARIGALDGIAGVGQGARAPTRRDVLLEVGERWRRTATVRARARPVQPRLLPADPPAGLAPYRPAEEVRAELDVLSLDVRAHVMTFYAGLAEAIGVTAAVDLLDTPHGSRVRVAGAKVATQTPPLRSGRRVVFVSLDDPTGISDAALFGDTVGAYAATVFNGWLLAIEGTLQRRGARGVALIADAVWDLPTLMRAWRQERLSAALTAARRRAAAPLAAPDLWEPWERRDDPEPGRGRLWHASGGSAG